MQARRACRRPRERPPAMQAGHARAELIKLAADVACGDPL